MPLANWTSLRCTCWPSDGGHSRAQRRPGASAGVDGVPCQAARLRASAPEPYLPCDALPPRGAGGRPPPASLRQLCRQTASAVADLLGQVAMEDALFLPVLLKAEVGGGAGPVARILELLYCRATGLPCRSVRRQAKCLSQNGCWRFTIKRGSYRFGSIRNSSKISCKGWSGGIQDSCRKSSLSPAAFCPTVLLQLIRRSTPGAGVGDQARKARQNPWRSWARR